MSFGLRCLGLVVREIPVGVEHLVAEMPRQWTRTYQALQYSCIPTIHPDSLSASSHRHLHCEAYEIKAELYGEKRVVPKMRMEAASLLQGDGVLPQHDVKDA